MTGYGDGRCEMHQAAGAAVTQRRCRLPAGHAEGCDFPTPRQEHLEWAKARALAHLPARPQEAVISMASDLRKYRGEDGWSDEMLGTVTLGILWAGHVPGAEEARRWVEGFA